MIGDHLFWAYLFPLLIIVVLSIIVRTCFVYYTDRFNDDTQKIPKLIFIIYILLGLIPFFNYVVAGFGIFMFISVWCNETIKPKDKTKQSRFIKWLMK